MQQLNDAGFRYQENSGHLEHYDLKQEMDRQKGRQLPPVEWGP
jgi:hypothetical protein